MPEKEALILNNSDIHKSCIESTFDFSSLSSSRISQEYISRFIQRVPSFGVKRDGYWSTVHGERVEKYISEHLYGARSTGKPGLILGTLAPWYPKFGILDIDERPSDFEVSNIKVFFNILSPKKHILFETSKNSYHVLFRPVYNGRPATTRLLHRILGPYAKQKKVELYPQPNHIVRAPYHAGSKVIQLPRGQKQINNIADFLSVFDGLDPLAGC